MAEGIPALFFGIIYAKMCKSRIKKVHTTNFNGKNINC
jgi:hypothetical protein